MWQYPFSSSLSYLISKTFLSSMMFLNSKGQNTTILPFLIHCAVQLKKSLNPFLQRHIRFKINCLANKNYNWPKERSLWHFTFYTCLILIAHQNLNPICFFKNFSSNRAEVRREGGVYVSKTLLKLFLTINCNLPCYQWSFKFFLRQFSSNRSQGGAKIPEIIADNWKPF